MLDQDRRYRFSVAEWHLMGEAGQFNVDELLGTA